MKSIWLVHIVLLIKTAQERVAAFLPEFLREAAFLGLEGYGVFTCLSCNAEISLQDKPKTPKSQRSCDSGTASPMRLPYHPADDACLTGSQRTVRNCDRRSMQRTLPS